MTEKKVIIISLFIFAIIAVALIYDKYRVRDLQWATITEEDKALLVSGDVIFTEGNSFKSDIVRMASGVKGGQHYSHCGFIVEEEEESSDNNEIYVVHMSIDKGVITKEPIDSFWSNNKVTNFAICRADGFAEYEAIKVELDNLILDEMCFDNSYDASKNNELYCTELICYIFEKVSGLNLYPFENLRKNIYPNNLFEIQTLHKIL